MRFKLTPDSKKEILELDRDTRKRIYDALRELTKEPPRGDVKQLKGELSGISRLRVGEYRILFVIENNQLIVARISSRQSAYK